MENTENEVYEKDVDKKYKLLAHQISQLADETKEPEKHIVQAMSYQVDATGDLDDQIEKLNSSIKALNRSTSRLMSRQIWLIVIQTILAVLLAWAAIKLT